VEPNILRDLQARRGEIRAHWETLLRLERASSPLAQPDTLVHLLDTTLDEIYRDLELWSPRRHPTAAADAPRCPCGRNPFLAYFAAGRQAMRDALIRVQTAGPAPTARQRDLTLACVDQVFSHISSREVTSFCGLCQFRDPVPGWPGVLSATAGSPIAAQRRGG
jgi:hypothetical protein